MEENAIGEDGVALAMGFGGKKVGRGRNFGGYGRMATFCCVCVHVKLSIKHNKK